MTKIKVRNFMSNAVLDSKVAVVGAGMWGFAVTKVLSKKCRNVIVYSRNKELVNKTNLQRINPNTNQSIASNIFATNELQDLVNAKYIFMCIPAQSTRDFLTSFKKHWNTSYGKPGFVICSKGIEASTGMLLTEVFLDVIGEVKEIAVLSGPNFALDVFQDAMTISVIASKELDMLNNAYLMLNNDTFCVIKSQDIIGLQVLGAAKNVYSLCIGILYGLGMSNNTIAAFMTFCFNEMYDVCFKLGCDNATILTPAGIGDFLLSGMSRKSRNMDYGYRLASGELDNSNTELCEGVYSAAPLLLMAKRINAYTPLLEVVCKILQDKPNAVAINAMLACIFHQCNEGIWRKH